jgi:D-alanyl-lipoteichoic acid acyltransferase DltB (MBOAT superfamily)
MLFNSLEFLGFFPLVFALYWLLHRSIKAQNFLLLVASYFFYGSWDWRFLSLIIFSSCVDFFIGLRLKKTEKSSHRKWLLSVSLVANLGILGIFKYYDFFIESFINLLQTVGFQANITTLNIILPVGISFYTFQTLSYTIDVYRRKLEPTSNALNFFVYVAFFPQLVAGPIERAINLLPQFSRKRVFEYERGVDGIRQILWGFFKKVVIADNCAVFVDAIFDNSGSLGGGWLLLGAVLFAFQIYADFSGYSDIAIGTARLLGFDLMQNFAFPYFSRDIAEFWRRWHISLSTWFRDYLYIPLGGSRVGTAKKVRNIFAIFLVSGFWHGANWTFIVWGGLHALFYLPLMLFQKNRVNIGHLQSNNWKTATVDFLNILKTFLLVCLAWIFFRAETVGEAFEYCAQLFDFTHFFETSMRDGFLLFDTPEHQFWNLAILILVMLIFEWFNRKNLHGLSVLRMHFILRYLIYYVLLFLIIDFFHGERTFIYFQF